MLIHIMLVILSTIQVSLLVGNEALQFKNQETIFSYYFLDQNITYNSIDVIRTTNLFLSSN
jgi:hypothetical protein